MPNESPPPTDGCRLCGSTWGNVWETVDGRREFFCCELCAVQWRTIRDEVRRATGWSAIDTLELAGGRWGRSGTAVSVGRSFRFTVVFTPEGALRRFDSAAPRPSA